MIEISQYKSVVESFIHEVIVAIENQHGMNRKLYESMQYVMKSNSKRIRGCILMHIAKILGIQYEHAIVCAAAIELVHNYTIVHDDLPGMDDDSMRRGIPTCHEEFGEGIAILTGNALFTLALQIVMDGFSEKKDLLFKITQVLLSTSGFFGILSGQAADLEMKSRSGVIHLNDDEKMNDILNMYYLKTGKLFEAAFLIPGIIIGVDSNAQNILAEAGSVFGILYQISDDIEDNEIEGDIVNNVKAMLLERFAILIDSMSEFNTLKKLAEEL